MSAIVRFTIGPKKLGAFEKRLAARFRSDSMKALHAFGKAGVIMLRTASAHIRDTGAYQNGWNYQSRINHLEFINVTGHAIFVERGRAPGKRPPIDVIKAWCMRRFGSDSMAWAVARKIGLKGIRPRPVLYARKVQSGLRSAWKSQMEAMWSTAMRKSVP